MTADEDLKDYQAGKEDSVLQTEILANWAFTFAAVCAIVQLVIWCLPG